jgi:hypothetical protein
VPKFGLNDATMADNYYVHFGSGKTGASVPVFFKLLRICNLRISGSLESINAVLGCSILMPEDLNMPEPSTADYIIHCINWFRYNRLVYIEYLAILNFYILLLYIYIKIYNYIILFYYSIFQYD